jgi:hypothetical protein
VLEAPALLRPCAAESAVASVPPCIAEFAVVAVPPCTAACAVVAARVAALFARCLAPRHRAASLPALLPLGRGRASARHEDAELDEVDDVLGAGVAGERPAAWRPLAAVSAEQLLLLPVAVGAAGLLRAAAGAVLLLLLSEAAAAALGLRGAAKNGGRAGGRRVGTASAGWRVNGHAVADFQCHCCPVGPDQTWRA